MKAMLQLPTIKEAWRHVRKAHDVNDVSEFQHRDAAKQLATELGYVCTDTHSNTTSTQINDNDSSTINNGWHCFSCCKSVTPQPFSLSECKYCKQPRFIVT
jgi:hypothetical protein